MMLSEFEVRGGLWLFQETLFPGARLISVLN